MMSLSDEISAACGKDARIAELEAAVTRFRECLQDVVAASKSGADTVSFLIELHRIARRCAAALKDNFESSEAAE